MLIAFSQQTTSHVDTGGRFLIFVSVMDESVGGKVGAGLGTLVGAALGALVGCAVGTGAGVGDLVGASVVHARGPSQVQ